MIEPSCWDVVANRLEDNPKTSWLQVPAVVPTLGKARVLDPQPAECWLLFPQGHGICRHFLLAPQRGWGAPSRSCDIYNWNFHVPNPRLDQG